MHVNKNGGINVTMSKGCHFQGSKRVFHGSLKKKNHSPVAFLFEWNFTLSLTAIHFKTGKPDFIKVGGTPYKSWGIQTHTLKEQLSNGKTQIPMQSCEQVVFSETYNCCYNICSHEFECGSCLHEHMSVGKDYSGTTYVHDCWTNFGFLK